MPTYEELSGYKDEDLIHRFNELYQDVPDLTPEMSKLYYFTGDDYLNELHRREESRRTDRIVALTEQMAALTGAITILTLITTAATVWQIARDSSIWGTLVTVAVTSGLLYWWSLFYRQTRAPRHEKP